MKRRTHLYTDEQTFWHCTGVQASHMQVGGWVEPPAGSYGADTPGSKRRLLNLVRASHFDDYILVTSSPAASREALLRVHPAGYIDEFKRISDAGAGELGPYAPFSKGAFEIASVSAGLAIAAVDSVLSGQCNNSYALCRPAGHHCLADQPMGFCLLANIPIAVEAAKASHGIERVAVIDWDVHHGNGTQSIFYDRSDVLTISLHQEHCFPPGYSGLDDRGIGAGFGFNLNIPLPAGSGDETYLYAMDQIVLPAVRKFKPDMIVVACGLDACAFDPLGRQLLHSDSYRSMTTRVSELADELCDGRLVVVHEGGYSEAYAPFCGMAVLEVLANSTSGVADGELELIKALQPSEPILRFHKTMIQDMRSTFDLSLLSA
jgi:acetoin utilization deacetylase AcuC-like enzyme